jgi:hypothetical protein
MFMWRQSPSAVASHITWRRSCPGYSMAGQTISGCCSTSARMTDTCFPTAYGLTISW